ncbi:hypothetical protein VNO77_34868 [Canavalia gladiata]|uniref:Uncharacterized protein n=1 Tax=Canavalia gladiata TaxID=3824 RepID=A0AAN9KEQ2_CANGL
MGLQLPGEKRQKEAGGIPLKVFILGRFSFKRNSSHLEGRGVLLIQEETCIADLKPGLYRHIFVVLAPPPLTIGMRVPFDKRGNQLGVIRPRIISKASRVEATQFMRIVYSDSIHSIFGHSLVKLVRLRHDMGYSPLNHSFECKIVFTRVDLHRIVCTHTRVKATWTMMADAYVHASSYLKISLHTHNPSGHWEPNVSARLNPNDAPPILWPYCKMLNVFVKKNLCAQESCDENGASLNNFIVEWVEDDTLGPAQDV